MWGSKLYAVKASPKTTCKYHRRASAHVVRGSSATVSSVKPEYLKHRLPNGLNIEVIKLASAQGVAKRQELLFLHGSFHGAWCWQEKFLPYFSALGHECSAISWRGQGGSDWEGEGVSVATLDAHAADLDSFVRSLTQPPVVISHSFGGLVVEKYLLTMGSGSLSGYAPVAGAAFLCAVPPSGNKALVGRYLKKDFMLSMRITWGMITKSFVRDMGASKEMFFSADLPQEQLERYQQRLSACSPVRLLDLQDMNRQVPLPPALPPVFVLGAQEDNLVDPPAVRELADYYGVEPVMIPNMAHDCMLDTRWQLAADALATWLTKMEAEQHTGASERWSEHQS